ncbi:hypothetical protein [Alicyclobacillus sp. SP_1]|jgi:hypothetical protein|uniref:hypothetical protein n=1 Tax=Alicyclobacillus sp. SP_1 TaxID=2942475 RepID=UPI002157F1BA|nr:hypothetical protein [Alicyclobacillus sp. SP_1]
MHAYLLPLLQFVLYLLMAVAGAVALVQGSLVGLAIIRGGARERAEALARLKWVAFGTLAALSALLLARFSAYLAHALSPAVALPAKDTSPFQTPSLASLPGNHASGVGGWILNEIFLSIDGLCTLFAMVFWAFTGFQSMGSMAAHNVYSPHDGDLLGVFAPQTWAAMMTVQHTLYALVGIAAVVSFVIQGIRIASAQSSARAREGWVDLLRNVLWLGVMLGITPYLLGLLNAGVSDITLYLLHEVHVHTAHLSLTGYSAALLSRKPLNPELVRDYKLFGGASVANSVFGLVYAVVNFCVWLIYLWRRVVLAILVTLMPLFFIGYVTGKRQDLAIHWWKEVITYLAIPMVGALMLLMASVFLGI